MNRNAKIASDIEELFIDIEGDTGDSFRSVSVLGDLKNKDGYSKWCFGENLKLENGFEIFFRCSGCNQINKMYSPNVNQTVFIGETGVIRCVNCSYCGEDFQPYLVGYFGELEKMRKKKGRKR